MSKPTTVLSVNGFEVTATFAENHNAAAVHHVKQILISSFAGKTTKLQSRDILVIPDIQRYNNGRTSSTSCSSWSSAASVRCAWVIPV